MRGPSLSETQRPTGRETMRGRGNTRNVKHTLITLPGLRPSPVVAAKRARERNVRVSSAEPPGGQRLQKLGRPPCMQAAISCLSVGVGEGHGGRTRPFDRFPFDHVLRWVSDHTLLQRHRQIRELCASRDKQREGQGMKCSGRVEMTKWRGK